MVRMNCGGQVLECRHIWHRNAITSSCTNVQGRGGGGLYAWSGIRGGQVWRHGLGLGITSARLRLLRSQESGSGCRRRHIRIKRAMGFLFYANLVRFVLRGGLAIVVMEQARSLVRAAGAVLNG